MTELTQADLQELFAMADKRNQARWAWLRWLLMLAAGSFSVLVSLHAGKPYMGLAKVAVQTGLGTTLLALLFGAVALYAETQIANRLFVQRRDALSMQADGGYADDMPYARPSWPVRVAAWLCYLSLCTSALSWLVFVWLWPVSI